jgi:signal transduction histidine kinase
MRNISRFRLMVAMILIVPGTLAAQEDLSLSAWYRGFESRTAARSLESLLQENKQALQKAWESQHDSMRIFLLLEGGMLHVTKAYDYERGMNYYLQAVRVADSIRYPLGEAFSYFLIARAFEDTGNPEKSLQFMHRAHQLIDPAMHTEVEALFLLALGRVYLATNQLDEAQQQYERVLELQPDMQDYEAEAEALGSLGTLEMQRQNYERALELQRQALGIWRKVKDRLKEAQGLNTIGALYEQMKNTARAYANYKAALEIFQPLDDRTGMADAWNNIGVWYYRQKKFKDALANLELALGAARSAQSKAGLRKSYDYLSLTWKALGDYRRALDYREQLVALNDFIQKEENDQRLLDMQSRYTLEEKEKELAQTESIRRERERELAEQKRIQVYLYGILALSGVILVLIVYLYIQKQRSNRQLKEINERIESQNIELQNLNATKDKFFSIISHDLKGPLNSLTSFSNLLINHFDALSKEEIQGLARDLDKSLKNLFNLLNNLLAWARSQTGNIDFTREPFDISQVLEENRELLQAQAATKSITILSESPGVLMTNANRNSVTTVVRNLLSNAIKFTPVGGAVKLQAEKAGTEIRVSVSDTGVGMSKKILDKLFRIDAKHTTPGTQNETGTGLGLILCKDFVEKNGGRIWVESEEGKGSVFYFTLAASEKA